MPNRPIMAWGLTARPKTAGDGDEYIDLSTGVHYVYQDGIWHDGAPTPIVVKDAEPVKEPAFLDNAEEGALYQYPETGEVYCYRDGKWNQVSFKVEDEEPVEEPKPKKKRAAKKTAK